MWIKVLPFIVNILKLFQIYFIIIKVTNFNNAILLKDTFILFITNFIY